MSDKSALDAAVARTGFPLVAKIQSRDIPHKSEVGGVRVGIATKGEVFLAYEALLDNARRHRPDAAIQGVLLAPMAKKGVEIIVGTLWMRPSGRWSWSALAASPPNCSGT